MGKWDGVVEAGVRRLVNATGSRTFTRQQLIEHELDRIVAEACAVGETPEQTVSRELQQLARAGVITFIDNQGTYQLNS
jgi:putative restriction endonuclease